MSAREQIAQAANTVEGVTATPYYTASIDPGTVYVRLDRVEWPNPFGGVQHLNVVLVLPQGLEDAERYLERMAPLLREAVEPHLHVTSLVPQRLDITGVGIVPVALLNGYTEMEN